MNKLITVLLTRFTVYAGLCSDMNVFLLSCFYCLNLVFCVFYMYVFTLKIPRTFRCVLLLGAVLRVTVFFRALLGNW
jgi:hypothetical protein